MFNAQGAAIARADYEPFGELFTVPTMPGTSELPAKQFTGQERDAEASLDYFGARFFVPRTGRFSQVDPVYAGLFDPQQWNRYAYVRNNPLTFVDPTGMNVEGPRQPTFSVVIWGCASCLEDFLTQQLLTWVGWGWGGGGSGGGNATGTEPDAGGGLGVDLTPTPPPGGDPPTSPQTGRLFKKDEKKAKKAKATVEDVLKLQIAKHEVSRRISTNSGCSVFYGVGAGAALWDTPFSIVNRPGYVDSAVAAVTIWESPLRSASEVRVYLGGAFFTGPGAGMEFYGTPLVTYQALIVAHELAHVLDRIPRTDYPTNSKAIGDNLSNSQRVHRACF